MFANKEQTIQIVSLVLETSIQRKYARFTLISPLRAFIPHGVRVSLDSQVIAKITLDTLKAIDAILLKS